MLSPQLRRDVFELWTLFWSSGMSNPLVAIEQITFLLFLKQLEELDYERRGHQLRSIYAPRLDKLKIAKKNLDSPSSNAEGDDLSPKIEKCLIPHAPNEIANDQGACKGHESCRWSYIRENPSNEHISQYVFPWLREISKILHETGNSTDAYEAIGNQMDDAYFQFPKEKSEALKEAIRRIDELFPAGAIRGDLMGDIFEELLKGIQSAGKNGQFRTPRHIIRFMIHLLKPEIGKYVLDPTSFHLIVKPLKQFGSQNSWAHLQNE